MATRIDPIEPEAPVEDRAALASRFSAGMGLADLTRLHRRFERAAKDGLGLALRSRVAVLSNHATQFLERGLELALAARGVEATIHGAPFDQWESELIDPNSATAAFRPDIVVLTLTSALLAYRQAAGDPRQLAGHLAELVAGAAERLGARILVTLPEPLEEEAEPTAWAAPWRRALNSAFIEAIGERAVFVDFAPLIAAIGAKSWYAARYLVNGKFIANPETTAAQADFIARHLVAMVRRPVRLVAVDLDDTLWGGVVGEEGWRNVDLDLNGKGYAFLRLQRFLRGLHDKGVVLAVVSKNNPEDALEVFRNRPEMILREEHFAEMRINWEPKSRNLAAILETLNLTEVGTVFLDDNPVERGEIRCAFPEVLVPEFPADPVDLVPQLMATGRFAIPSVGHEDSMRQTMYAEERTRRESRRAFTDLGEYYASLGLELTPHPVDGANEQRVLELLAKTNQFNTTTRRHNRAALEHLRRDPGNQAWAYGLTDRHGGYGLIAVVIGVRQGDALRLDSWLMSCRAMGRTVENAIFRHVAEAARAAGARRLEGEFVPTAKNLPVAGLYPALGFVETRREGGATFYEFDLARELPENRCVAIRA